MCYLTKHDQNHVLISCILIIHNTTENTITIHIKTVLKSSLCHLDVSRETFFSFTRYTLPENKTWFRLVASITIIKADPRGPCWQNHILICSPLPPLLHLQYRTLPSRA